MTPKPATSFTANILSIAATAPRFSYLPISNPALSSSALRRGINSTQQTAGLSTGLGAGGLAPATTSGRPFDVLDQTGNYSFANISVGRVVSAASAEQRAAQSAESTPFQVSVCPTTVMVRNSHSFLPQRQRDQHQLLNAYIRGSCL